MDSVEIQRNISRDVKYTLVLAGGRGKRLKDLTKWRVKPAVPFGGKYRIIDFALSNCRIKRAVIDKECKIPDGAVIGEDHEKDKRRFYVSPEGIVLVTPDSLGQLIHRVR